jgi:hypothetical protein
MGAVFDGYESARRKHEEQVAALHRKEEDVDQHLHALAALLDEDKAFMQEHGISHQLAPRALHVVVNRSPVVTVHYEPEDGTFRVTFMADGANVTPSTAEEAARAIGGMLFDTIGSRRP